MYEILNYCFETIADGNIHNLDVVKIGGKCHEDGRFVTVTLNMPTYDPTYTLRPVFEHFKMSQLKPTGRYITHDEFTTAFDAAREHMKTYIEFNKDNAEYISSGWLATHHQMMGMA